MGCIRGIGINKCFHTIVISLSYFIKSGLYEKNQRLRVISYRCHNSSRDVLADPRIYVTSEFRQNYHWDSSTLGNLG